MLYDMTEKQRLAWEHYDKLLDRKIAHISELSGVSKEKMVKINPAEHIEKNKNQIIDGFKFTKIREWIKKTKTDENYLISPCDDDFRTANQISYKERLGNERIRASKCKVFPISHETALDFYARNHRQSLPVLREQAVSFGLVYRGRLVGAMTYDKTNGAVRGASKAKKYELLRLAFAKHISIAGGGSRLQKHCEQALRELGEKEIFSYSNATINSGRVYEALGFESKTIDDGQPFVIMEDYSIVRLITLHPYSTDYYLAKANRFKTHIGGNKLWIKHL